MIIDTHVHIWDLEKSRYPWLSQADELLKRTYAIEELNPLLAGVSAGILVQADIQMEDSFHMLDQAAKTPWIKGVVSWLPLTDPQATHDLLEGRLLKDPYFVGVRHLIHDEADPTWLLQPSVLESLQLLATHQIPYDIVGVLPQHIDTVIKVAEKMPDLRMVFDHLNQPPIATGERFGEWGRLMKIAARFPGFYAKISGLGGTAGKEHFDVDTIKPYVAYVLEHFGVDRCFCGGDWPVSLMAGSYIHTWEIYKEVLSSLLSQEDLQKTYSDNAIRFYDLNMA